MTIESSKVVTVTNEDGGGYSFELVRPPENGEPKFKVSFVGLHINPPKVKFEDVKAAIEELDGGPPE